MRSIALVFATSVCACGSTGTTGSPIQDDTPDAGNSGDPDSGTVITPPQPPTFTVTSPNVVLNPGDDATYCYYFRTANQTSVAIQRWASHMTAGADQVIVYLTDGDQAPMNTLKTDKCGLKNGGFTSDPVWAYSATASEAEATLPGDDGTGTPLGMVVTGSQSGFLQMHFHNATSAQISAHVELDAYAYAQGTRVTPATTFMAVSNTISIAAGMPGSTEYSCLLNADPQNPKFVPKFFLMAMHTHALGTHTSVSDGSTVLYDSGATPHLADASWQPPAFYSVTTNTLTYHCDYMNTTASTVTYDDSSASKEICMMVGYYFPVFSPSIKSHYCLNAAMIY